MRNNPYNEYFLEENYSCEGINVELPLRLQKRQLLKNFGFEIDTNLQACPARNKKTVNKLYEDFLKNNSTFHILVSARKMKTCIPPLFTVNPGSFIEWRDDYGRVRKINKNKMNEILDRYSEDTWVEFAANIWSEDVFAGRLLYNNAFEQDIEIQKGVKPSEMVNNRKIPTYFSKLNGFNLFEHDYLCKCKMIEGLGYYNIASLKLVNDICNILKKHKWSFRSLYNIANKPTLEFAYNEKTNRLTAIDIDWPKQWKNQGGSNERRKDSSSGKTRRCYGGSC